MPCLVLQRAILISNVRLVCIGEWWKGDVRQLLADALHTGGEFQPSDANTINSQPGDLFPCSRDGTFTLSVEHGKTYTLRLINAALANEFFFGVAGHRLTVVGTDASYVKPFTVDHVFIAPGQTVTALLRADRALLRNTRYYMTARPLSTNPLVLLDNSTATAVLEYTDTAPPTGWVNPDFPTLPATNDSAAAPVPRQRRAPGARASARGRAHARHHRGERDRVRAGRALPGPPRQPPRGEPEQRELRGPA